MTAADPDTCATCRYMRDGHPLEPMCVRYPPGPERQAARTAIDHWCGEHAPIPGQEPCLHLRAERREGPAGNHWACTACGTNMDAAASREEPAETSDD